MTRALYICASVCLQAASCHQVCCSENPCVSASVRPLAAFCHQSVSSMTRASYIHASVRPLAASCHQGVSSMTRALYIRASVCFQVASCHQVCCPENPCSSASVCPLAAFCHQACRPYPLSSMSHASYIHAFMCHHACCPENLCVSRYCHAFPHPLRHAFSYLYLSGRVLSSGVLP